MTIGGESSLESSSASGIVGEEPVHAEILCANDWIIQTLLVLVGLVESGSALFLIGGFSGPFPLFLRIVFGSFLLFVLPGILILRIFRIHHIGPAKTLIYAVTLSLAFDLGLGLQDNFFLPILGVARPVALAPVAISYVALTLGLTMAAIGADGRTGNPVQWKINISNLPQFLLLSSVPVLMVLGTALENATGSNVLLMALIPLVTLVIILLLFKEVVPESLYTWALFCCAVALVLHFTLASSFLVGRDIIVEFLTYRFTDAAALWSPNFPINGYNATMSITILPALFARFTSLDGVYFFKVAAPVLFCLSPLVMYLLFRTLFPKKVAIIVAFLPVCMYQFYTVMPQTVKTEMGWLFVTAGLLALLTKRHSFAYRAIALFLLAAAVVSHYYSSYLATYLLLVGALLMLFRNHSQAFDLFNTALLLLVATFAWYAIVGGGINISVLILVGQGFLDALRTGFASLTGSYGINLLGRQELSPARSVLKYLYLATYILVTLGLAPVLWRWARKRAVAFSNLFVVFSAGSFVLLISVLVPGAAASLDLNRAFSLSMLFLAPFVIVAFSYGREILRPKLAPGQNAGATLKTLLQRFVRLLDNASPALSNSALVCSALLAVLFLLFGSGWASQVEQDRFPLSPILSRATLPFPVYYAGEIDSAAWVINHRSTGSQIYYDDSAQMAFAYSTPLSQLSRQMYGNGTRLVLLEGVLATPEPGSYIYLREINLRLNALSIDVIQGGMRAAPAVMFISELPDLQQAIADSNIVFDNGVSQVCLIR